MGLAEFLTARLDEDEAAAKAMRNMWDGRSPRLRREVAAKRAILALSQQQVVDGREVDYDVQDALEQAVRHLAAVYADHPDYDPAWKPE